MTKLDENFRWVLCIWIALLQGCAIPGFSMVDAVNSGGVDGSEKTHILGYRPVVEDTPDENGGAGNAQLIKISPQLIKQQQLLNTPRISQEVNSLFGVATPYSIGPGDVVGIIVYDHPELLPNAGAVISQQTDPTGVSVAPGFIVGNTGEISFPYVGRVRIEGLTEIEASELIKNKIATYIRDPQVTVRIQSFRSRRAYIEGEVKTPGIQIFTDVPMTLAEAISRAGGINATGDRSYVTLTRNGQTTIVNLPLLLEAGRNASQIPLKNGDLINVKSRDERKVYVMGEVLRPSALLMRNGRLTLNEALGEAGGPNLSTANPGQIYVIRNSDQGSALVFNLDAKNPVALALADRFELRSRDVVYIDPVPLVQWNRVVSLIIPSAQVVYFGSNAITK